MVTYPAAYAARLAAISGTPTGRPGSVMSSPIVTSAVHKIRPNSQPSRNLPAFIPGQSARSSINNPYMQRQNALRDKFSVSNDWGNEITAMQQQAVAIKRQREAIAARQAEERQQQALMMQANVAGQAQPGKYNVKQAAQWGGFRNGRIPGNALQRISFAPNHAARADAAAALERMNAAYRKAFGRNISITDSYRDINRQVALKRQKPNLAATPGRSNHGWGIAFDLGGGINSRGTAQHNWMVQNAHKFGFYLSQDKRVAQLEPWHWEFRG